MSDYIHFFSVLTTGNENICHALLKNADKKQIEFLRKIVNDILKGDIALSSKELDILRKKRIFLRNFAAKRKHSFSKSYLDLVPILAQKAIKELRKKKKIKKSSDSKENAKISSGTSGRVGKIKRQVIPKRSTFSDSSSGSDSESDNEPTIYERGKSETNADKVKKDSSSSSNISEN